MAGSQEFENVSADGVTVWCANTVSPADPERPIRIDLGRMFFFFGRRLVVKNAR